MPTLGKYQIEAEIGRGAMGVVYRAKDPQIGRQIAIKTIFVNGQEPEDQAAYRDRFFQEARAAGRLTHPGIVTIFDAGQDPASGDPYIVMENVDGQSLSRILISEGGKLPLGPALQLAQEIAEALDYAHQQGVIHRDIKPGNILVTRDGHIKIADFGVARLNESEMTVPGQILGSPAYMSPEQLRGDEVDARSDLFSLGVLMYRILTGYRPFQGNSVHTVAFKVANYDPMPASSFESGLPADIDAIVTRALAKEPKDRYQTASDVARDIEHLRESMGLLEQTAGQLIAINSPNAQVAAVMANASGVGPQTRRNTTTARKFPSQSRTHFPAWIVYAAGLIVLLSGGLAFWMYYHQQPTISVNVSPHLLPPPIGKVQVSEAAMKQLPQPNHVAARKSVSASQPHGPAGNLLVEIDHPFHQGDASVWVDDQLVYDETLQAGARSLLFRKKGTSTHSVPVLPGKHTVRVRVADPAEKYDASQTVAWTAASGQQTVLMVHCDKTRNLLTTSLK